MFKDTLSKIRQSAENLDKGLINNIPFASFPKLASHVPGIVKELLPNANIVKNANTYELIANSDVVITPPSSIITESLILNKPVFLFKIFFYIHYTKFIKMKDRCS